MRSDRGLGLLVLASLLAAAPAQRLEPEEAMQLCCPGAKIDKKVSALDAEQRDAIAERSGEDVPCNVVCFYEARHEGEVVAVGYVDASRVRSKKQVLLVVVACTGEQTGKVRRIEVLAFAEPRRFLPGGAFYEQFEGRSLDADLREGRDIRRVSGATMTTRATVAAVRRVLATHAQLTAASR